MKRLQILLEEEMDHALAEQAARERTSKASLIRHLIKLGLRPVPPLCQDPLSSIDGMVEFEPADIDEVVYGR